MQVSCKPNTISYNATLRISLSLCCFEFLSSLASVQSKRFNGSHSQENMALGQLAGDHNHISICEYHQPFVPIYLE